MLNIFNSNLQSPTYVLQFLYWYFKDITDSQQEKENRSERCGDRNAPSDSNTQGTPPEDEQNKSNTVQR